MTDTVYSPESFTWSQGPNFSGANMELIMLNNSFAVADLLEPKGIFQEEVGGLPAEYRRYDDSDVDVWWFNEPGEMPKGRVPMDVMVEQRKKPGAHTMTVLVQMNMRGGDLGLYEFTWSLGNPYDETCRFRSLDTQGNETDAPHVNSPFDKWDKQMIRSILRATLKKRDSEKKAVEQTGTNQLTLDTANQEDQENQLSDETLEEMADQPGVREAVEQTMPLGEVATPQGVELLEIWLRKRFNLPNEDNDFIARLLGKILDAQYREGETNG